MKFIRWVVPVLGTTAISIVLILAYIVISAVLGLGADGPQIELEGFLQSGAGLDAETVMVMASLAAPTALGAVFYASITADQRTKKQIDKMIEIDDRAAKRQQAEWSRQDAYMLAEKREISEKEVDRLAIVCTSLEIEMDNILADLKQLAGMKKIEAEDSKALIKKFGVPPVRPIYEALGPTIRDLPPKTQSVIARYQSLYQRDANIFAEICSAKGIAVEKLAFMIEAAKDLRETTLKYRDALAAVRIDDYQN